MPTREMYVRAAPERFDVIESYPYRFDLSKASSVVPIAAPTGRIRAVYPYQAEAWYHSGVAGAAARPRAHGEPTPFEEGSQATVGHLLFTDWQRTDVEDELLRTRGIASAPLQVPVDLPSIDRREPGFGWRGLAAVIEAEYEVRQPDTAPLTVRAELMDREALSAERAVAVTREKTVDESTLLSLMRRPGADSRGLVLVVTLGLAVDRTTEGLAGRAPTVVRVALSWPTIPWSESLHLIDEAARISNPEYRAEERAAVWLPRYPMDRTSPPSTDAGGAPDQWRKSLVFSFDEVADIAAESHLRAEVEIDLPERLLSGLAIRHFDAAGFPIASSPKRTSRIVAALRINLREMLRRQTRSLVHRLWFEGVALGERRVADVRSTLADCGLTLVAAPELTGGKGSNALLIAERPTEGETLRVMVLLRGSRHSAVRTTDLAGGRTYQTEVETGDLELFLHGRFRGASEALADTLDTLHGRLRSIFGAITDHR